MSFLYATTLLCKCFRSLAHSQKGLHCIDVIKLDVDLCGSLVFSNLVRYMYVHMYSIILQRVSIKLHNYIKFIIVILYR